MAIGTSDFIIIFAVAALATIINCLLRIPRSKKTPLEKVSYRVQNVPCDWSEDTLREVLANHFKDSGNITIRSYAEDIDGKSKVCTVLFEQIPQLLLKGLKSDKRYFTLPPLCLDRDFLGLTVLHRPPTQDHHVDVILVPGLGGHALGSFKERKGEHVWPRDSLPTLLVDSNDHSHDSSIARIITYGYSSGVQGSKSAQHIGDIAKSFQSSLLELVRDSDLRPIVLIGHSMGGLVIKETLISLSQTNGDRPTRLFQAIRGIAFFGVPHTGMDAESIRAMTEDGPNRPLTDSLSSENSYFLAQQLVAFNRLLKSNDNPKLEIIYFYETELSPTAKKDSNGKWAMNGPVKLLVPPASASLQWADELSNPVKRTHSEMVKFGPYDDEWQKVSGHLQDLVDRVVRRRGEEKAKCSELLGLRPSHMSSRSDGLTQIRLPGTCEWLLDDPKFRGWKSSSLEQNPNSLKVLLLKGKPGSGKSVAMKAALDSFLEDGDEKSNAQITLSFFFDSRNGSFGNQYSENAMYGALLLQLMSKLDTGMLLEFKHDILKLFEHLDGAAKTTGIQDAIHLVLGILKFQRLFIFIDALDECTDLNIGALVCFFDQILRDTQDITLRLCLSSCTPILFEDNPGTVSINVSERNEPDIDKFLLGKLKWLERIRPRDFHKIVKILSARASNVFLWADLVVEHIGKQGIGRWRSDQELFDYIDHIPGKLTDLYRHLLHRIHQDDRTEACDLFMIIQVAKKPLTIDEVKSMLTCSRGSDEKPFNLENVDIVGRIQSLSCGLVECQSTRYTTNPVVQFIHKSLGDFLVNDGGLSLDGRLAKNPLAQFHLRIFGLCMRTIGYRIEPMDADRFLPYAAQFWMTHARESEGSIKDDFQFPSALRDCDSYDAERVLKLFKKFDSYESYQDYSGREEVPNSVWLESEDSLIVFLAFEGCKNLISHHLMTCRKCQSPSEYGPSDLEKAFFLAAYRGFASTAKVILDGAAAVGASIDIDAVVGGTTPLYAACLKGKTTTVEFLLQHGSDVSKSLCQPYQFALHAAAAHDDEGVVDAILRHERDCGSDIGRLLSARTDAGYTVFHQAILEGRSRVLERLLYEIKDEDTAQALRERTRGNRTAYELATWLKMNLGEPDAPCVPADETTLDHATAELGRFELQYPALETHVG
ncbi:unnamed protein product [Clonostachys rosea]|uniref:Nephrocystin 3-like N-terminal domain-containing protein n=1 Tax=Bionectria ochroleuca TaxID=29856 RepID=A0ABY6UPD7_BIOOC|nr:unnamed protein product [Clonostachys rosea]